VVLDHALATERRERASLGIAAERLDHVSREVEAVGNLPAAVDESRPERDFERREGNVTVAPTAPAYAKTLHGLSIIDPKCGFLNVPTSLLHEAEVDGEWLVRR
jgi:hypothetical protein